MSSVKNKVALITGGASGIGLGIVLKLIENGAKGVSIVDINQEAGTQVLNDLKASETKVIFIRADVRTQKDLEDAFEETIRTFNQLDIVFNNAGVDDEENWERCLAINLGGVIRGTYLALRKYLPEYKSGEEGVVVNTSSVVGINSFSSIPAYCASKNAIIGFGRSLGTQYHYEKYKVKVLTLCPGLIKSNFMENAVIQDFEYLLKEVDDYGLIEQTSEFAGESVLKIVDTGKNGSVWVFENHEVYELLNLDRKKLRAN